MNLSAILNNTQDSFKRFPDIESDFLQGIPF